MGDLIVMRSVLYLLVVGVVYAKLNFNDCGSLYSLEAVDIEQCNEEPCYLLLGEEVNVSMTYIRKFSVNSLEQKVTITVMGIPELVDAAPRDLCSVIECKGDQEEEKIFTGQVKLRQELPPWNGAKLKWRMTSTSQDKDVICMEVDITLVEADYFIKKNQNTSSIS